MRRVMKVYNVKQAYLHARKSCLSALTSYRSHGNRDDAIKLKWMSLIKTTAKSQIKPDMWKK